MKTEKLIIVAALGLGAYMMMRKAQMQGVYAINPSNGQRYLVPAPTQNSMLAEKIGIAGALINGIKGIFTPAYSEAGKTYNPNVEQTYPFANENYGNEGRYTLGTINQNASTATYQDYGNEGTRLPLNTINPDAYAVNPPDSTVSYEDSGTLGHLDSWWKS